VPAAERCHLGPPAPRLIQGAHGGASKLLVRFDDPSRPSSRPEFATDGKRLFFTIGTRQIDIWAMELIARR
jgi:hypothetical protein